MKTALITGATSGIGEEFAKRFAKKGYRLILVGRREDRLNALAKSFDVPVKTVVADLSSERECVKLLKKINHVKIDVFINNAGFGTAGAFLETDLKKEINMIHVNDIAMHILFKGLLRKMQKEGYGTILNVCSSAGLLPAGPYMATYYATKAYMVSLTRAVAQELKEMGSNVYVCALCPGPVDTEFNQNADVVFALKGISVKQCVREALEGMSKHEVIIVPSLQMKLAMTAMRFIPMDILIKLTGRQQKKKIAE